MPRIVVLTQPAPPLEALRRAVEEALAEDVGTGDATSEAVVPADAVCTAEIRLQEPGVVCGLDVLEAVFSQLDASVHTEVLAADGDVIESAPVVVARSDGPARAILSGERTGLNFLGRLSGVATLTRRYVDAVAGTGATILDTRKTTPGLRALEKYAVRCGGGANHRFGLDDAVLVKDNHLRLVGDVGIAVRRALANDAGLPVEIECETLADVRHALEAGARRILLDNMTVAALSEAVALADGRATLEASGGVTLDTVRAIAETGVDFISIGGLTHSARSLDVSLEVTS